MDEEGEFLGHRSRLSYANKLIGEANLFIQTIFFFFKKTRFRENEKKGRTVLISLLSEEISNWLDFNSAQTTLIHIRI